MKQKRKGRTPRTKAALLPLPAALARNISIEYHLALAAMRSGNGTHDTMVALMRALYMTYFMLEAPVQADDLAFLLDIEAILQKSIEAAAQGQGWFVSDEYLTFIERLLLRLDTLVGGVPSYRYREAWARLDCFVKSSEVSPLPGSRLLHTWQ
ncbi:hypothetical protein [Burkholderia sp. GS2Y]|uniref:Fis family transcriptional regulator n=1 Tax=Burkholderia theae TaxID=3143496 RepID=A0ABU9W8U0_9BURK